MSGHPHPGKRSAWFKCKDRLPTLYGLYEAKIKCTDRMQVVAWDALRRAWVTEVGEKLEITVYYHGDDEWRGLAEEPE